ncbi:MAG: hypothetical protein LUE11_00895 [Clostridia bacterium]|nr:hypothetical protein [Clostridia bacterium]
MKRKKWERKHYKWVAWFFVLVLILYVFVIFPTRGLTVFPVEDVFISNAVSYFLPQLLVFLPILFGIGWALKNESRRDGILQAIGFAMIFIGVDYVWYTAWHTAWHWTVPIPETVILWSYIGIIALCFILPRYLGGRGNK